MRILEWLGLATLAWLGLALVEIAARGQSGNLMLLGYLPSAALLWSAEFGAVVALVWGVHRLLAARWPRQALFGTAVLLALAGLPSCWVLSAVLVEGEWIAKQSWAASLRVALVFLLELVWLGAWAFYGASVAARDRRWRTLLALVAVVGLAGVSFALQGPLQAYTVLAKHAVGPAWLIAFGLACQLRTLAPRAARYAGVGSVVIGVLAFAHAAFDRDLASFASTELAGTNSFAGIAESLIAMRRTELAALPFERVRGRSCPASKQPEPLSLKPEQRRNVIWLSIDTLRRDALDKRIGDRVVAPNLQRFRKRSLSFDRAVSPSASTLFSLSVAVSGYSPTQLSFMRKPPRNVFRRVRGELPVQRIVMPDWKVFRASAYKKLIVQDAPLSLSNRKADPLEPFIGALEDAKAAGERGFFWLHLAGPHSPYAKHKAFDFGSGKRSRYYGEVAHDEALVGRVLDYLEARGYFADSLIVIFADHGEALGENGFFGHGISMRARFTDIPLLMHYPGVVARASTAAVSLTSLTATVLHYLGRPIPQTLDDCSLLQSEAALARCAPPVSGSYGLHPGFLNSALRSPIASHADLAKRWAQIQGHSYSTEMAFTTSNHRYMLNVDTGAERLFDRVQDPHEKQNLTRDDRALVRDFRGFVKRWTEDQATRIACRLAK